MEETSIDGLVAHCQKARFTGILRIRAKEGIGEIWFLSGMTDEMQFGTSTGDEALERMRKATDATYELATRLPHPGGGFKKRFPIQGSIATATPVTLMRYCEQYALTCKLAVESKHLLVEATYQLGELVSVETTADDDGITSMLEATEGSYEFTLPKVELPEGTPVLPPASTSIMESIPPPESVGVRALLEIKPPPVVGRAASGEAEVKRKTVEMARQSQKKATTPRAPVPRPASTSRPDKEEVKPVVIETKKEPELAKAAPVEEKKVEEKKVEEKKVEPEPVKKTEPEPEPAKVEAKPEPVAAKETAKQEAEEEAEEEEEEEEDEERESEPPKKPSKRPPPQPETSSRMWLVVPLLFAVAIAYLLWTNRM